MSKSIVAGERIVSARTAKPVEENAGALLRTLVSEGCGASDFSTGTTTLTAGATLAYHRHTCSEAVTILKGEARMSVEGRTYLLGALDCIHIPAGAAHSIANESRTDELLAHWALATAHPAREAVTTTFAVDERGRGDCREQEPETIVRFDRVEAYELSAGAWFRDLFAKRFGSAGICGGYGRFAPGASLPCHVHDYDESITIVEGAAACWVQGTAYELSSYDTAYVPKGRAHRFLNLSDKEMAMIWVYAGDEPDRTIVEAELCMPGVPVGTSV